MPTSPADDRPTDRLADPEATPRVSVVIATHNRRDHLVLTLDALARQTCAAIEVIVVDDDSSDGTADLVAQRGLRCIRVPRGGPGRARQVGWAEAHGPIVAFTDDDCIPTPGWLSALVEPIENGTADLVQGRTLPRPDQTEAAGPWSRTQHIDRESGTYPTCNMAYRRSVLEATGGFRPSFAGPRTSGEDTELAWRAKAAGFRSAFAPDALVHHEVWPSRFGPYLRDRLRWGMIVQVVRFHPGSRSLAYRRWFYRPSHVRIIGAAVGLTILGIVRWWLPPALCLAAVVAYGVRGRGVPGGPLARMLFITQTLLADAFEVAVFVWSSIRYRTLLL